MISSCMTFRHRDPGGVGPSKRLRLNEEECKIGRSPISDRREVQA